jgi:hypothetical protein
MTRHVSTESLARFTGGDLRGHRARRVEAHLRGCARCRETSARLNEVPALLATTRVPEMPAHLAARIETALATESAHRAAGVPSARADRADRAGRAERAGRASHGAAGRRGRRPGTAAPALRLLAAAGAVVIVAGGGFELVTHLGGGNGTASSASGGGAQKSPANSGTTEPRAVKPALGPKLHYRSKGKYAAIVPVQTAMNYRPDRLGRQAARALTRARPEPGTAQHGTMTPDTGGLGAAQLTRLSGCLGRIANGHRVLLVDLARFNHAPATLIVTAGRGTAREAWIVGPRCSASVRNVLAHQPLPGNG